MSDINIVKPDLNIFKEKGFQLEPSNKVIVEMNSYIFDHIEYPEKGGILAYFKDCPFPAKGFPFPQAIQACNIAKRFFKRGVDVFMSKYMAMPILGFMFSSKKRKIIENILDAYSDGAYYVLSPYFLSYEKYSECPKEIRYFLINFLKDIGIRQEVVEKFSEVFSTLIQYDDAYRLRIEDIMSETTKEKMLKNPSKEIKKLINIFKKREPAIHNVDKFDKLAKIMILLFIIPKYKKAFIKAIKRSEFTNFQLDDSDRYHCMLREDYDFMGYNIKERIEMYKVYHSVFIPTPPRISFKLKE